MKSLLRRWLGISSFEETNSRDIEDLVLRIKAVEGKLPKPSKRKFPAKATKKAKR